MLDVWGTRVPLPRFWLKAVVRLGYWSRGKHLPCFCLRRYRENMSMPPMSTVMYANGTHIDVMLVDSDPVLSL